jgi:hypothetical protein
MLTYAIPQALAINCSSTRMSIIDINGVISFYDMEVGRGKSANEQGVPPGEHLSLGYKPLTYSSMRP